MGDVVTLVANTPCGAEPEGWIAVTTLYVDQDYVIDQVCWQYAYRFHERLDVSRFLDTHHVEPTQAVRIGKHLAGLVMPWLDELFALGAGGGVNSSKQYRLRGGLRTSSLGV